MCPRRGPGRPLREVRLCEPMADLRDRPVLANRSDPAAAVLDLRRGPGQHRPLQILHGPGLHDPGPDPRLRRPVRYGALRADEGLHVRAEMLLPLASAELSLLGPVRDPV